MAPERFLRTELQSHVPHVSRTPPLLGSRTPLLMASRSLKARGVTLEEIKMDSGLLRGCCEGERIPFEFFFPEISQRFLGAVAGKDFESGTDQLGGCDVGDVGVAVENGDVEASFTYPLSSTFSTLRACENPNTKRQAQEDKG